MEMKELWDGLMPQKRKHIFKLDNSLMIYSTWDELTEIEKRVIKNAFRIAYKTPCK